MVDLPRRVLYVLLSETGKPVLQLMLGSCLAAVFCWRCSKQSNSAQGRLPLSDDVSATAENDEEFAQ